MDTGALLTFWGTARLGRVLTGLGQLLAVQAQPRCLYSHSSVPASLAVPHCSYAPCRNQQCGAKPGLFLHLPTLLQLCSKSHEKGRQAAQDPTGIPASWLGLRPGHGAARIAAGRFIPSTGLK